MSFNAGVAWVLLLDPTSKTSVIGRANHEREEARKKAEAEKKKGDK